jgi:hypothetical protein
MFAANNDTKRLIEIQAIDGEVMYAYYKKRLVEASTLKLPPAFRP